MIPGRVPYRIQYPASRKNVDGTYSSSCIRTLNDTITISKITVILLFTVPVRTAIIKEEARLLLGALRSEEYGTGTSEGTAYRYSCTRKSYGTGMAIREVKHRKQKHRVCACVRFALSHHKWLVTSYPVS